MSETHGLTSHSTLYSHFEDGFTGQMTQPTASKALKEASSIPPESVCLVTINKLEATASKHSVSNPV